MSADRGSVFIIDNRYIRMNISNRQSGIPREASQAAPRSRPKPGARPSLSGRRSFRRPFSRRRPASFLIFDISENRYRLIVHVAYPFRRVLIKFVGTQEDYDKIDPETG